MTTTVIKSGRLKGAKPYVAECKTCNCQFSFERTDAKYQSDQRDGDFFEVKCPECSSRVYVLCELTGWVY